MDTVQQLHDISDSDVAAWHDVLATSVARDLPGEPTPTLDHVHSLLTTAGLDSHHRLWTATHGDQVIGVARLRLFDGPGRDHLGQFTIDVRPGHRRRGVGSLLLEAVVGPELVQRAYDAAVERRYLWHEFGDVSLLLRR